MAPKQPRAGIDSVDLADEIIRRGRYHWVAHVFSSLTISFLGFGLMLQAARPATVVVRTDDPSRPAEIVNSGDARVREVDAKRFVRRYAEHVMGWNSANVTDELNKAVLLQTPKWNTVFEARLNEKVKVPTTLDASGQMSQYGTYLAASVRNAVTVDFAATRCAVVDEPKRRVWNCTAPAVVETQPLIGEPLTSPETKRRYELQAQFVEVEATQLTADGLLVNFWNQVEAK